MKKQLQIENSGFVKTCDEHVHRQLWREILNFQLDQCKPIREGSFHQSGLQHFAHLNLTCLGGKKRHKIRYVNHFEQRPIYVPK